MERERVPTQTDLVRLCDSADQVARYYKHQILRGFGTVRGFNCELELIFSIIRLLPYPRHYWTPFDIDFWEARDSWNGWSDSVYDAFAGVLFHARNVNLQWIEVTKNAKPNQRIQAASGFVEQQIDYLEIFSQMLRREIKHPMPFDLISDASSQSLYRTGADYKGKSARLGNWFPVVLAICNAGGNLCHEKTEQAYFNAGFTGQYKNAFRKAVSTEINKELLPLDLELSAVRGKGWRISLFHETLP